MPNHDPNPNPNHETRSNPNPNTTPNLVRSAWRTFGERLSKPDSSPNPDMAEHSWHLMHGIYPPYIYITLILALTLIWLQNPSPNPNPDSDGLLMNTSAILATDCYGYIRAILYISIDAWHIPPPTYIYQGYIRAILRAIAVGTSGLWQLVHHGYGRAISWLWQGNIMALAPIPSSTDT